METDNPAMRYASCVGALSGAITNIAIILKYDKGMSKDELTRQVKHALLAGLETCKSNNISIVNTDIRLLNEVPE